MWVCGYGCMENEVALKLSQQLSSPDFSSGVGLAVHGVREVMCNA